MGFLQARILEWGATSCSRRSSRPRNRTWVSCTGMQFLYHWATREAHVTSPWIPYFVTETLYLSTPFIRATLPPSACLCLFSVSKSFFFLIVCFSFDSICWYHIVSVSLWLILLSVILPSMLSQMARLRSLSWHDIFTHTHTTLSVSIHPQMNMYLGCFHILGLVNNAALNAGSGYTQ